MLGRLFLLFTVIPLVELWLLVQIGEVVGLPATLAAVVTTGALGASLAKREGLRTLRAWQDSLARGQLPEEGLASGLLILVGGIFLVTPGVLTDVLGLSMLLPPLRRAAAAALTARARGHLTMHAVGGEERFAGANFTDLPFGGRGHEGDEGDVIDVDAYTATADGSGTEAAQRTSREAHEPRPLKGPS